MEVVPLFDVERMLLYNSWLFDQDARIEAMTEAVDDEGNVADGAWSTVTGLGAVPCYIDPASGERTGGASREITTPSGRVAIVSARIYLQGLYTTVTEEMRVVVGGATYGIVAPPILAGAVTILMGEVRR